MGNLNGTVAMPLDVRGRMHVVVVVAVPLLLPVVVEVIITNASEVTAKHKAALAARTETCMWCVVWV
jgi:hypothetical protein